MMNRLTRTKTLTWKRTTFETSSWQRIFYRRFKSSVQM